jgi:5-oxoprolinase (ATP-hydrolysing)
MPQSLPIVGLCRLSAPRAATGRNYVIRADGSRTDFSATAQFTVAPGDIFVIETPGGGGYGRTEG